jgi:hypothetical protein
MKEFPTKPPDATTLIETGILCCGVFGFPLFVPLIVLIVINLTRENRGYELADI